MYKVEISKVDAAQHAAIDRRRRLDKERQTRIFNPKFRIDVETLEEQIKLKESIKEQERRRQAAFDHQSEETNQLLIHLDNQSEISRRNQAKKVADYRHVNQKHDERREYHLNDPLALRKEPKVGGKDPKHYSNLQQFSGEDVARETRVEEQHRQVKTWTVQSIQERADIERKAKEETEAFEAYQDNVAAKARELERRARDGKAEMARMYYETNEAMSKAKEEKKKADKAAEDDLDVMEILSLVNGKLLNESNDPQKYMGDIEGTLEMNALQIKAVSTRAKHAKKFEMDWADKQAATNQALLMFEQEREEKARRDAVQIREENQRNAEDARKRRVAADEEQAFHPDFFNQFNRGSR